jgi:putative ABC transport system permease protein
VNAPAWRATLRIARREAWQNKGRSLLVIALIGLPVLVLAGADIAYRTWQLDPGEKLTRTLGSADAIIAWGNGGKVTQSPKGLYDYYTDSTGSTTPSAPPTSALVAALPPGSRIIEWRRSFGSIVSTFGRKSTEFDGLDYADPAARGLVHQVSGRAPRSPGEIAFTRSLAHDTGLRIGDTVQARSDGAQTTSTYRLVGIVADASYRHTAAAYTLRAGLPQAGPTGYSDDRWLATVPGGMSWADVQAVNQHGYVALSRHVFQHPPPKSQVSYRSGVSASRVSAKAAATGTLIGGMALLEIVLLAGPAFAVSARRQRRDLALIAAVGGRRRDLRNVVLSKGIVLGVAGGLISIVAAIGLAAIGIATVGHNVNQLPGHFDARPLELLALTGVSLLTALAAAVFPARGAARTDVVAALAGRRGVVRTRKRVPLLGVVVAGIGVVVALGGLGASANAVVILAGVALTEIGLIICLPALLGLISRVGRWLPLSPRIALRDAGRNRSSAAPAIAAVMAAVIGCIAVLVGVASANDQSRRSYSPTVPMNDAYTYVTDSKLNPANVADALRSTLPGARVIQLRTPFGGCPDPNACPTASIDLGQGVTTYPNLRYGFIQPMLLDDGTDVQTLLGATAPSAVAALRRGEAVATDPSLVHNGKLSLDISQPSSDPNGTPNDRIVKVAAVVVDVGPAYVQTMLPPALASRLGLTPTSYGILAAAAHRPTEHERQAADGALAKIDPDLKLYVETGYHNSKLWMMLMLVAAAAVIAVGATMIATALSNVDSRPDLTTLGAVGAAPRTRRLLSMSRAGVIAAIGTLLGALAGFVPSFAWIHSQQNAAQYLSPDGAIVRLHFIVPWLPFVLTVVVVPLVAMLIAGVFSRSRLPSERAAD